MIKRYQYFLGLAALLFTVSCQPTLDEYKPEGNASVDFKHFIAVGNSLTSGYADGGLSRAGQEVAFPNLMAKSMAEVGGGEFRTPLFTEEQRNGSGYIRLKDLVNGNPVTEAVTSNLAYRAPKLLTKYTDPIENLGVPGMRLDFAFAPGVGTTAGNMYFERLLKEGTSPAYTYFTHATSQDHTFFSFWLGNNDVLLYATNGGVTTDATNRITTTAEFRQHYTNFINALTAKGQKGVVATIPEVTATPHFTTVTRAALLQAVNANTTTKVENIYISTKAGTRPATDDDFFLLPFSSKGLLGSTTAANPYPYGLHPDKPVEDMYVLDKAEAEEVKQRTKEFNTIIKEVAEQKGLALADAHAYLNQVKAGIFVNGIQLSARFIQGNVFSLDGIHLTPMGNALLANLFIDAINKEYNTRLTRVDFTKFRGVIYP